MFICGDSLRGVPQRCYSEFGVHEVFLSLRNPLLWCLLGLLFNYILIDLFNFAYMDCELCCQEWEGGSSYDSSILKKEPDLLGWVSGMILLLNYDYMFWLIYYI